MTLTGANNNSIPLVSICCVTYNHEKYIRQCLEGFVVQQTNFLFEILVHEDASTDDTAIILKEYEIKYPHLFKCVYQTENQFLKQNTLTNILFPMAKGKYISLCEGDDYWTDEYKLQKQVDFLEANEEYNICFHQVKILKNNKLVENYITQTPERTTTIEDLSKGNFIHTVSSVFRNNLLNGLPKWFGDLNAGDYPLHMLLAEKGKIFFMNECMSVYRIHEGGIYSGADPIRLREGNILLLNNLRTHFTSKVVERNLRVQLAVTINTLAQLYLDKGIFDKALRLAIKYPLLVEKKNFKKLLNLKKRREANKLKAYINWIKKKIGFDA